MLRVSDSRGNRLYHCLSFISLDIWRNLHEKLVIYTNIFGNDFQVSVDLCFKIIKCWSISQKKNVKNQNKEKSVPAFGQSSPVISRRLDHNSKEIKRLPNLKRCKGFGKMDCKKFAGKYFIVSIAIRSGIDKLYGMEWNGMPWF